MKLYGTERHYDVIKCLRRTPLTRVHESSDGELGCEQYTPVLLGQRLVQRQMLVPKA